MTKVATAGVASCAVIALAWFKNNEGLNDSYLNATQEYKDTMAEECYNDLHGFYNDILYPTEQELGETEHHAFDCIMDVIESKPDLELDGKIITALINQVSLQGNNYYWLKRLTARGFKLVDQTNNDLGMLCYMFIRNKNRPEGVRAFGCSKDEEMEKYV